MFKDAFKRITPIKQEVIGEDLSEIADNREQLGGEDKRFLMNSKMPSQNTSILSLFQPKKPEEEEKLNRLLSFYQEHLLKET